MGCLVRGILGKSDGAKHPRCIISSAAPHRTYFGEKYDRAQRSTTKVKIEGYKPQF